MLLRSKKTWLYAFTAICIMLLASLGVALFAPKTHTAYASGSGNPITSAGGELDNGVYYLAGDVELDAPLKVMVGKEATLNLNGHILKLKDGVSGSVITVDGGTLTLVDGDPDNPHDDIAIKGGVITGGNGNVNGNGGGVLIDFEVLSSSSKYGTLTMNGGTI